MRFDLIDLRLFLAVVDAGSITHGAADAGMSLPAASERLRDMEAAGEVLLLQRGRRGVSPTEAGEALAVARKIRPDFGFFDYQLPDADGATAVRRIRAERIRFPWVLMSGAETFAEMA